MGQGIRRFFTLMTARKTILLASYMIREIVKAVPSCPRTIAFVLVMEKMSNATDVFFFAATRVGP